MTKVLFIMRGGMDADYILSHLSLESSKYEVSCIIETGSKARKKKLHRMFKRKRNVILTFFDLVALYFYDKLETSKMMKVLEIGSKQKNLCTVEDVNDEECLAEINNINPDIVFIYGTGILTQDTITKINKEIYNIHSSILPYYRNVHSDFHAYMNKEFDKIGITILKLTSGIDSGDIALQRRSGIIGGKLYEHKVANLVHIPELIEEFMKKREYGELQFVPQNDAMSSNASTPKFNEIISFYQSARINKR